MGAPLAKGLRRHPFLVAKMKALRPGAELTFELIAARIEVGQIDKFSEFMGQFACQTQ